MSIASAAAVSKEAEENWPAWFSDQQSSAWTDYESTPEPTRKDEPWLFTNIGALDLSAIKKQN